MHYMLPVSFVCTSSTGQGFPPFFEFCNTFRSLDIVPKPYVFDHTDQADTAQSVSSLIYALVDQTSDAKKTRVNCILILKDIVILL